MELQKERIGLLLRALVTKPHNKTPYELLNGRSPRLDFMRSFGCPVTILNTLDPLGKFKGKVDEGFLVGYHVTSKALRVFNIKSRIVEENLHEVSDQHHIVLPLWSSIFFTYKSSDDKAEDDKPKDDTSSKTVIKPVNKEDQAYRDKLDRLMSQEKVSKEFEQGCMDKRGAAKAGSTNSFNIVSNPVNVASTSGTFSAGGSSSPHPDDTLYSIAYDDDLDIFTSSVQSVDVEADFNNMEYSTVVSPIPTHRVYIDHPKDQILGDPQSAVQTRRLAKKSFRAHAFVSYIHKQRRTNHKDYENCLFACFLSQMEPKKKVWRLVDLPYWKKAIGTKWVYRNKKDEKGIVVRNKARLVAQGHKQEEGIDYDEVFTPVARIVAIRIFLAFASFMGFIVYQMDVKSAFLYDTIEKEVYVSLPPGFIDPQFPNKNGYRRGIIDKTLFIKTDKDDIMLVQVYVDDIIFGSTKKSLYDEFEALMHKKFHMSSMRELTFFLGLQVKQSEEETQKPLVKDEEAADVDVHLYRSMIRSLKYLTASRPNIMFKVCACSRFQVTPKLSHLHAVKRIFRYLKGQPKLGLWYLRDSSFDLEAYSDSGYVEANLDRKSTTSGCQFLGKRLISW
uniref:Retrovirus-related Pol polyprotein from transposon TNT 1-94 n=1 Tax=Tanacetum cinerariifolium TaxID=118510 RepID=A0A6L2NNJ9_TANCI|nr:retrovirus-related Pol polyprotein from transposon TNT 1-94 [Tanacetum cinerariifolium]